MCFLIIVNSDGERNGVYSMRKFIRWVSISKRSIVILFFVLSIASCNNGKIQEPNYCIGSFTDYAYDINDRRKIFSTFLGVFVNDRWIVESQLPEHIQKDGQEKELAGETNSENGKELWIYTGFHYLNYNRLYENSIDIYNVDKDTWRTVPLEVQNYDCIVDRLLIVNNDVVFASNTGNKEDENFGEIPVLSKYDPDINMFIPVYSTVDIFSGTKSEKIKKIIQSQIFFDGIDSIWIFSDDELTFIYNIYTDEVTEVNILKGMNISYVAYNEKDQHFILRRQNSGKKNILGLPHDYDFLVISLDLQQVKIISEHPIYWPNSTGFWFDTEGNLWFDTIGYMDTDQNWKLLMPAIGRYIYEIYHNSNELYIPPHIVEETSDGKIWFVGYYGIAWLNEENSTGCWDSIYARDIFEDDSGTVWMINPESLYYLK
jgi:hypothetical protein